MAGVGEGAGVELPGKQYPWLELAVSMAKPARMLPSLIDGPDGVGVGWGAWALHP